MAISGNQWQSVASLQKAPPAISGNQWQSVVISGELAESSTCNQWQLVAISGNQWRACRELHLQGRERSERRDALGRQLVAALEAQRAQRGPAVLGDGADRLGLQLRVGGDRELGEPGAAALHQADQRGRAQPEAAVRRLGDAKAKDSARQEWRGQAREKEARWQSVTISDNQWQSVAISGSQWQSVAVSGSQLQSVAVAIGSHRKPSEAVRSNRKQSAAIGSNRQQSAIGSNRQLGAPAQSQRVKVLEGLKHCDGAGPHRPPAVPEVDEAQREGAQSSESVGHRALRGREASREVVVRGGEEGRREERRGEERRGGEREKTPHLSDETTVGEDQLGGAACLGREQPERVVVKAAHGAEAGSDGVLDVG